MHPQLTQKYLNDLRQAVQSGDISQLTSQLVDKRAADIADVIANLNFDEVQALYRLLEEEKAADVLVHLDDDLREKILSSLSSKEIATKYIDNLASDDAADVIAELPAPVMEEVISHLENIEQASDIVELLDYAEGTAGALMAKELIRVNMNSTVWECVREMRKQAESVKNVYAVYVVDEQDNLKGILSLKKLLTTSLRTKILDVCKRDVIFVKTNTPSPEVAKIMEKYDFVVLPVVDGMGRLVGRITIDDVVDVMKEEADKDFQMASGHSEVVAHSDNIWVLSRSRLPWLLVGLCGGILGAKVIGLYESQILIHPEMAFFMPLIAAMGGNVGVQSSAIIVQGLASKSIEMQNMLGKLFKEFTVAVLIGLVCSSAIFCYNYFTNDSWGLSITVSTALFSVIIFAALVGTFVPLLLDRAKIDPALATGPFITTVNDILGLSLYFIIGRLLY